MHTRNALLDARTSRYPAIAEHGFIGDLHSAALVTTNGTIDWYCCPRFDAPSVFAAIPVHRSPAIRGAVTSW